MIAKYQYLVVTKKLMHVPLTKVFIDIEDRKKGATLTFRPRDRVSVFASSKWCQVILLSTMVTKLDAKARLCITSLQLKVMGM